MSRIVIIEERCKGCLLCTEACPKGLLRQSDKINRHGYKVVECIDPGEKKCTGCTACAIMCPDVAIRVFRSTPRQETAQAVPGQAVPGQAMPGQAMPGQGEGGAS